VLRAEAVTRHMQRALVERAQGGDLDAFTQLVKVYAPRLHGVAYLILHDIERAQDAVQDALLMGWRDLRALREPDAFEAWLRRLTVRACFGLAKKERRRNRVELHVTPIPDIISTPDTSTEHAERDWLHDMLGRLAIDQRAVVVLHYYLDLPVNEVAEILDIPYGTAASRLHRGLESMRRSMRVEPGAARSQSAEAAP
jgi:RNA polymerase sigma factor (sigma-70 family)